MVDISVRLEQIKAMVDQGDYFTINRARQYGKTTTLQALSEFLAPVYIVISLDFQNIGKSGFQTEGVFTQAFARLLMDAGEFSGASIPQKYLHPTIRCFWIFLPS